MYVLEKAAGFPVFRNVLYQFMMQTAALWQKNRFGISEGQSGFPDLYQLDET
ncbi:hypothetical protein B4096_1945 [Heyndrickxia coagulans]|nr:hypothetical protein B4096_1945 [Heyndrickxia coagulans]